MILYEDKDIIVCHKPAGLPVQSARLGQKDMVSILNNHLAEQQMEWESVHVVHRLDQPVEGVIVFAKHAKAAANLTKQIQENRVEKVYHAVCCVMDKAAENVHQESICGTGRTVDNCDMGIGSYVDKNKKCGKHDSNTMKQGINVSKKRELSTEIRNAENPETGKQTDMAGGRVHLEDYMIRDGRTNTSRIAGKQERDAKKAVLDYEVLRENEKYKMVRIYLQTGRHHQIRVQMAHAGLPLYGDQKYNEKWQEFMLVHSGSETGRVNLALCAVSYAFAHPVTGKKMKFEVEPGNQAFQW